MEGESAVVEVADGECGKGVVASRDIRAGTLIMAVTGSIVEAPDRYTIQLGEGRHVRPDGQTWAFLNHACAPNCTVDVARMAIIAARDIRAGEELTFNYLTTEWDMSAPFRCGCAAPNCLGLIAGARHLDPAERQALLPLCSPYVAGRIATDASRPDLKRRSVGRVAP